ncbi:nuclear transport factor 2 family protein [Larkinella harenae]
MSIPLNKSIVRNFYQRAIAGGDLDFANQIIADNYLNHSPLVKPGKAGLMEALNYVKNMPKPATTAKPFMRLIAEGDYVVTNLSVEVGEKAKAVVDLFRIRNGQLIEHWDVIEDQPETSLNGHPMMGGAVEPADFGATARNKALVADFFQTVFVDRKLERLPDFVATDLVQHHPNIANGIDGLRHYLQRTGSTQRMIRIIGEGNFVVVQSAEFSDQRTGLFFDIFRLNDGKIVEHWSVKQTLAS